MKNKIIVFLTMLFFSTFWVGCSSDKKEENKTITIGAILPLTGKASFLGTGYKNAMELALTYIHEKKIITNKIEILYEDSQGLSNFAANAAQKLINIQKCNVLIPANGNVVETVYPIAKRENIPLIAITSTPNITQKDELIYRIWLNEFDQINLITDYINYKQYSRVAFFYVNNNYGQSVFNEVEDKIGHLIAFQSPYPPNAKEIKNQIIKIRNENVDAIYIEGNPNEYITLIKQIREANINCEIIGSSALTVKFVLNALGSLMNNVVFTGPNFIDNKQVPNEISRYFSDNFTKIYKTDPEWFFGFCFDQILFVATAIKNHSNLQLNDALKLVKEFEGVNGIIKMNKVGDSSSKVSLFKIDNGNFVKITLK